MSTHPSPLNAWLSELGNQQGTQFKLDDQGHCQISADNKRNINLYGAPGSQKFYINVELINCPADNAELLLRSALGLNLFQHETRGTTIALDEKSAMLMLCYSGEYDSSSFQNFCNVLNNMIELSATLSDQLESNTEQRHVQSSNDMPMFGMLC